LTQQAHRAFLAIPVVAARLHAAGRKRSLIHCGILISTSVVCATTLAFLASPRLGFSQVLPACQLSKNAVSISQANAIQSGAEIHMEKDPGNSKTVNGVLHLNLRNEGPTQPDQLCASAHLADIKGAPQSVSVALSQIGTDKSEPTFEEDISCFKIDPPWKAFQEIPFDLQLRVDSTFIPLSGSITLNSDVKSKETSAPQPPDPRASSYDCTSSSKLLTQSVMLLPSISSSWLEVPLIGAFVTALAYLLISLWVLRKSLRKPVGGPQWNFATSFATNFTIGTGLLTPLLGANVITDALHYMTKFHYVLLSMLFAGLLLLAPGIFSFFSIPRENTTPAGQTSTVPIGSVGLFLATAALMICAVLGQLITVGLAFAEIRFRGYIGWGPLAAMLCLLLVAGIGTILIAARTIGSYLGQTSESVGPSSEHLQSIVEKFASLSNGAALGSAGSELFTAHERQTIERVTGRPKTELRTWTMF
jgi:hypothetical protein